MPLPPGFFARPTLDVARDLVGASLVHRGAGGVIVEVEAYQGDAASHFVTRPRTGRIMGTTHGRIYVYAIYGLHRCLNFTTDATGPGAVLLRALAPRAGLAAMRRRRGVDDEALLCSGPARLVQALGVAAELTGERVEEHFDLELAIEPPRIVTAPRVGISAARELPWRFAIAGDRFVSRPRPEAAAR